MAATPLSAYYPLFRGSQWVYNVVDDGKRRTDTETIALQTKRMHGQQVYQRVIDSSDGERGFNYENLSGSGQIQFHGMGDNSLSLIFSPPIVFPKLARVGQRTEMDGKLDAIEESVRMRGTYHAEVRVVGTEKVRVAAGTFNCLKVQMTMDFSFKYGNF
ncbi:MAG TPA: hypothetical protein VGP94_12725, partial [Tepidisphaeraceae bacterium]|nr:hypothetical protein [Tepidisphaeraceae bacterium]